jgi:ABC-2 type transport system ATP-binding protein
MLLANNILEVNGLSGGIGDFKLKEINLSIERGTVMGLIGKNGAGKTTLIQTISGFLPRCDGSVLFNGKSMTGNEYEVKNLLGLVLVTI